MHFTIVFVAAKPPDPVPQRRGVKNGARRSRLDAGLAMNRIAIITIMNRIAIITTMNRIATITAINRIATITTHELLRGVEEGVRHLALVVCHVAVLGHAVG